MTPRARDNPFRTECVLQLRYRFEEGSDWHRLRQRLSDLGGRAAIVGPHGAGKTTLQEDLAGRLVAEGRTVRWVRLNRENRGTAARQLHQALCDVDAATLIFVDGAEQLGPWLWRRLKRRSLCFAGLVITTHRPGRLPTLLECRTSPRTLEWMAHRLACCDQLPAARLEELFARHGGNLRGCLRELYDRWESDPVLVDNQASE